MSAGKRARPRGSSPRVLQKLELKENTMSYHDDTASNTSISTMALAEQVADEFVKLGTAYRKKLYVALGKSLIVYKRFLNDAVSYKELLAQENIVGLREKPKLKETSRLVLYFLTKARTDEERTTAGRYAKVVDYLYKEGVSSADVVAYIQGAGGIDEILKKARKKEAFKESVGTRQVNNRVFDEEEETDNADDSASSDAADDLFDSEQDASLRLGSEELERVLSSETPMNEVFYLECRKTGVGPYGIRIEGRLYESD